MTFAAIMLSGRAHAQHVLDLVAAAMLSSSFCATSMFSYLFAAVTQAEYSCICFTESLIYFLKRTKKGSVEDFWQKNKKILS